MQNVIKTFVLASLFNSDDIIRLFDNEDGGFVARRTGTETARINVCDVIAHRAEDNALFDLMDGFNQLISFCSVSAKDVKGQPLSRFMPDAGQALQLIN